MSPGPPAAAPPRCLHLRWETAAPVREGPELTVGVGEAGERSPQPQVDEPGRQRLAQCPYLSPPFSQRKASPVILLLSLEVVAGCEEKITVLAWKTEQSRGFRGGGLERVRQASVPAKVTGRASREGSLDTPRARAGSRKGDSRGRRLVPDSGSIPGRSCTRQTWSQGCTTCSGWSWPPTGRWLGPS